MARTFFEITAAEVVTIGELGDIPNNSIIYKDNAGALTELALGASGTVLTSGGATSAPTFLANGSGDVVGPASATANGVARFDGISGKLIQDSSVIITDDGDVSVGGGLTGVGKLAITVNDGDDLIGWYVVNNDVTNNPTTSVMANISSSGKTLQITSTSTGNNIEVNTDEFVLDNVGNVTAKVSVTSPTINGTTALQENGTNINTIYSPIAGSSSIVTVGALNSGSITSGFGDINNGASAITTTGAISGGSAVITNAGTASGIYIGQNGDNIGLQIVSAATSAANYALLVKGNSGAILGQFEQSGNEYLRIARKENNLLYAYRNLAAADTAAPVVNITQDNAGDDQNALTLQNDGTGNGVFIDQNGDGMALNIDSEATTQRSIQISAQLTGTNQVVYVGNSGAQTSGTAMIYFDQANSSSTQATLYTDNAGTGPCILLNQAQDVEVIDFDACPDGGTSHTTLAGSLKIQMPNGSTGYINFYT